MTKAEKKHLDRVAALGCIVCREAGVFSPAEIHHVRAGLGMAQRNHARVIPLCHTHHRTGRIVLRSMRAVKDLRPRTGLRNICWLVFSLL